MRLPWLLIERADELWSFSHLTFQEYFTVQWLTQLPSEQLAEKLAKQQWQEAVKQIVKSQQPADRLLRMIKQAIDPSIASKPKPQEFLIWTLQKSESIQSNCQPAAIRAFYFALTLDDYPLDLDHTLDRNLDLTFDHTLDFDRTLDHALDRVLKQALDLDHALNYTFDFNRALYRAFDFARAFELACDCSQNSALANQVVQLGLVLPPVSTNNWNSFRQWWQENGTQWIEQLRQVMIEHRNIGHDWQFTEAQTQQLQRYYDANKFLVELLKIKGAVSDSVRTEIEDSLLLPWEELQRHQS